MMKHFHSDNSTKCKNSHVLRALLPPGVKLRHAGAEIHPSGRNERKVRVNGVKTRRAHVWRPQHAHTLMNGLSCRLVISELFTLM